MTHQILISSICQSLAVITTMTLSYGNGIFQVIGDANITAKVPNLRKFQNYWYTVTIHELKPLLYKIVYRITKNMSFHLIPWKCHACEDRNQQNRETINPKKRSRYAISIQVSSNIRLQSLYSGIRADDTGRRLFKSNLNFVDKPRLFPNTFVFSLWFWISLTIRLSNFRSNWSAAIWTILNVGTQK